MSISDDGIGFSTDQEDTVAGIGLRSMQQKSRIINGFVAVRSEPNKGTTLHRTLPSPEYALPEQKPEMKFNG